MIKLYKKDCDKIMKKVRKILHNHCIYNYVCKNCLDCKHFAPKDKMFTDSSTKALIEITNTLKNKEKN